MIRIETPSEKFMPGQLVDGTISWSDLPEKTNSVEARLIWYTEGKGSMDFELIASQQVDFQQAAQGQASFSFIAPHRPLSFSGKIISLVWAIEAIAFPGEQSDRKLITISPSGSEILLRKND